MVRAGWSRLVGLILHKAGLLLFVLFEVLLIRDVPAIDDDLVFLEEEHLHALKLTK